MLKPVSQKSLKKVTDKKKLKEYYMAYYNENFLRNFRFIFDKPQSFIKDGKEIYYNAKNLSAYKYGEKDNSQTKALNFLKVNSKIKYGLLAGEITYFKTLPDFKEGNINKRYCDRFFNDFDIDDSNEVKILKEEFKRANSTLEGKELKQHISILQKDFQDLIFNSHLLEDVFNEAQSLCNYLEKMDLKPYLIFSGSKGFHVNIFFDEMQLTNFSQICQTLAMSYSKNMNLKYLDFNVYDKNKTHKRLQRAQYGVHSKTNLITRPLPPNISYDEMLTLIKKNKRNPVKFDFEKMKAPEGFNKMLLKLDNEISFKNAQRQKELQKINEKKQLKLKKKYGANYKSFNDIDLRDIARSYGIDGKHQGDRIVVKCPFHNDEHPSGVVFKERFHCSTCNMTLNYYDFISKLENTDDKDKILSLARKFLR